MNKMYEDFFEKATIEKNDKTKILLKYKRCMWLLTTCMNCKSVILRSTKTKIYNFKYHYCTRMCSEKCRKLNPHKSKLPIVEKKCDNNNCNNKMYNRYWHLSACKYHFCSRKCQFEAQKKGNIVNIITEQTMLETYGAINSFLVPELCEKRRQTWFENYGVDNPSKSQVIIDKIIAAQEKTGMNFSSQLEITFYNILSNYIKEDDIKKQKHINRRPIDFYIKSLDIYIQVDGEHWHGLDRPIWEIRRSEKRHDVVIYKKFISDRAQEKWFLEKNMRLLRITDTIIYDNMIVNQFINTFINNNDSITPYECYNYNRAIIKSYLDRWRHL